jgi:hypothetical protein
LYSRFILNEKIVIIEEVEHITNYHLQLKYAESSQSNEPYHYIKDLMREPFTEDAIKILEIYDSSGQIRVLNDKENRNSLFTPQPTVLQVPRPITGQALGVGYQARHYELDTSGDNVLNQDIDLPFSLEAALQSYVAGKVYSDMNGAENKMISQEHFANYEKLCVELETNDLTNQTFSTSHKKLEQRGFV